MIKFDTVEDCVNQYFDYDSIPEINVVEMGLYVGNTAYRIIDNLQNKNIKVSSFTAFDSFCGLPEEKYGVTRSEDWAPGNFSALEAFGVNTLSEAINLVQNKIKPIYAQGIRIIPGWFKDTLTQDLATTVDEIDFFHIDTDLFISTEQALNWAFSNHLIKSGCIIRYDDIASCGPAWGQQLAHTRATYHYNIIFERLSFNVYRVVDYEKRV